MSTLLLPAAAEQDGIAQIIAPHQVEEERKDVPRKWLVSARDYMSMAEIGLFEGQRVELIAGEIITMPPMSEAHAQSVDKSTKKLNRVLAEELIVRGEHPFNAGDNGRPQPDIAVVRPENLSLDAPPAEAVLIVEVSRSTLQYDRTTKASLYASLGISDYWIVNLVDGCIEVCRQPIEQKSAQFGWNYASRTIYQRGQSVALLEVPTVVIAVDDMLP